MPTKPRPGRSVWKSAPGGPLRPGGPCPLDMGETMTYAQFRTAFGQHSGPNRNGDAIRDDHRLPHLQRRWGTQPLGMGETMTYARFRTASGRTADPTGTVPHSEPYRNGDAIRDDHRVPHLQRRWATQPVMLSATIIAFPTSRGGGPPSPIIAFPTSRGGGPPSRRALQNGPGKLGIR